jgi:ketosteroid isomerase-like protein
VDREALLRRIYAAFNARDIDAVLAAMADDVDWPNAWEGGRVRGHAGVREYWSRQWEAIDPHVLPTGFSERPDGRVAVEVDQVVRDPQGRLIAQGHVVHVYAFDGDLVARMDVEEAE